MYNWVTRRIAPRTEGSTYPTRAVQTVDAIVATWIPVTAALLACFVTPARAKLDARYYESPTYPVRAVQIVDATVATWQAAATAELASFSTGARAGLDVRRYDWDVSESAWIQATLPPTVAQTVPAWSDETHGGRTSGAGVFDVRWAWVPSAASWIQATQTTGPTVAQQWPAMLEGAALSYRSHARSSLDVRRFEWMPEDGWRATIVDRVVATWTPIFDAELSARTLARAVLDVRVEQWEGSPNGWNFSVVPVGSVRPQVFTLTAAISNVFGLPAATSTPVSLPAGVSNVQTLRASTSTPMAFSASTSNTWTLPGVE